MVVKMSHYFGKNRKPLQISWFRAARFLRTCVAFVTVAASRLCYVGSHGWNGMRPATVSFSSARKDEVLFRDTRRHLMSAHSRYTDAAARCAFCVKSLPIVNGQLQPWRAASGLFFCNEFCADDAEEARFQSRGRAYHKAHDLRVGAST